MTMPSLHKIVAVENELHAVEQAEEKKADLWLKEQEEQILAGHKQRLAELEAKSEAAQEEALRAAEKEAAGILEAAEQKAAQLSGLSDETLCRVLQKYLVAILTGKVP